MEIEAVIESVKHKMDISKMCDKKVQQIATAAKDVNKLESKGSTKRGKIEMLKNKIKILEEQVEACKVLHNLIYLINFEVIMPFLKFDKLQIYKSLMNRYCEGRVETSQNRLYSSIKLLNRIKLKTVHNLIRP